MGERESRGRRNWRSRFKFWAVRREAPKSSGPEIGPDSSSEQALAYIRDLLEKSGDNPDLLAAVRRREETRAKRREAMVTDPFGEL